MAETRVDGLIDRPLDGLGTQITVGLSEVQLPTQDLTRAVLLGNSANTGKIFIKKGTGVLITNGSEIPSTGVPVVCGNTNIWYVISDTAGQKLSIFGT